MSGETILAAQNTTKRIFLTYYDTYLPSTQVVQDRCKLSEFVSLTCWFNAEMSVRLDKEITMDSCIMCSAQTLARKSPESHDIWVFAWDLQYYCENLILRPFSYTRRPSASLMTHTKGHMSASASSTVNDSVQNQSSTVNAVFNIKVI